MAPCGSIAAAARSALAASSLSGCAVYTLNDTERAGVLRLQKHVPEAKAIV